MTQLSLALRRTQYIIQSGEQVSVNGRLETLQATEEASRSKLAVEVSKEEQVTLISTVAFFQRACTHGLNRFKIYPSTNPRANGAKRRARVLIPHGYLHPGKGKHSEV